MTLIFPSPAMLPFSRINRFLLLLAAALALAPATLFSSGCSTSGQLAEGGWLFEGNDVIVVQADAARTSADALDRAARALRQAGFSTATFDRADGYLRTKERLIHDSLAVRLNVVATDSSAVEVAGQARAPRDSASWRRIAWHPGPSQGAWQLLADAAGRIGSITSYEQDPTAGMFGRVACGGRTCEKEQTCSEHVCVSPAPPAASPPTDRDAPPDDDAPDDAPDEAPPTGDAPAGDEAPSPDGAIYAGAHRAVVSRFVLDQTNARRREKGRAPLAFDSTLARRACRHNEDMLTHGFLGHRDSKGRLPRERVAPAYRQFIKTVGENVLETTRRGAPQASRDEKKDWAAAMVRRWMNSSEHRENILTKGYTHLGVCVTQNASAGRATQIFIER